MATRVLVVWVLILLVGWAGVFGFFSKHFSGVQFERFRVERAESKWREAERALAVREFSFQEYKDAVASAGLQVPDAWKNENFRSLASVTASSEYKPKFQLEPGRDAFRRAQKLYKAEDYSQAAEVLSEFIQHFPDSSHLPEAAYIQEEAFFHQKKFEECVQSIDFLVNHFPESDYAGYGLLRLGQIYEELERLDDAVDVYQTVITSFPGSEAMNIAKKALEGIKL